METSRLSLNGLEVAYREAGHGATPLILLHGLCSMVYTWTEVFDQFAQHTRAIAIDLAGFGATAKPRDENIYTIDAQARLVLEFMDKTGLDRAIVCGNSMGGSVALRVAQRAPHRVSRLVLLAPAVYRDHWRFRLVPLSQGPARLLGRGLALLVVGMMRSKRLLGSRMRLIYGRREVLTPERVSEYWHMLRQPDCQQAVVSTLLNWNIDVVQDELSLITQPTLILWGRRDAVLNSHYGIRLARDLPDAQLELLDCGHVPQEELPQEVARLVLGFIDGSG
jgi:pimeloyl-ACP methyl ester carboxylesterase